MRRALLLAVFAVLFVLGGGIGFLYSGLYDVGAIDRHWSVTLWAMEIARTRSIQAHAADISVPPDLEEPQKILLGTEHFAAHCAVCHGGPGVPRGDIAKGLYPQPPDLAKAAMVYTPGELFWILKHGIKMTGMPAWSDHTDDELWATVAFLKKLPGMSQQEYAHLVMTTIMQGGHHHDATEAAAESGHSLGGNDHHH